MIGRLRRYNDTLPYLVLGIVIYAGLIELAGVWFVKEKLAYSIGLWFGAAIAIFMAINMAKVIYDSVTFGVGRGRLIVKSLVRYFIVVILLIGFGYFKFGNLYTAIVGVFGLKIAAYLVPVLARFVCKLTGRTESFLENDSNSEKNNMEEVTM